jgi:hypothetical protein
MDAELFQAPFNLAGETQSSDLTAEAQARVRALAESEARKAQMTMAEIEAALKVHVRQSEIEHERFRKSQRETYGLSA